MHLLHHGGLCVVDSCSVQINRAHWLTKFRCDISHKFLVANYILLLYNTPKQNQLFQGCKLRELPEN